MTTNNETMSDDAIRRFIYDQIIDHGVAPTSSAIGAHFDADAAEVRRRLALLRIGKTVAVHPYFEQRIPNKREMHNSAVTKQSALSVLVATTWISVLVAQPTVAADTHMSVDLSPDGRALAFDSRGRIFTVPVSGGHSTRLTNGAPVDTRPVWSPDGNRIAFVRTEGRRQNVWLIDRQSLRTAAITSDTNARRIVSLSWSANGGAIAIAFGTSAPGFEIVDVTTGLPTRFAVEPMGPAGDHAVHSLTFAKEGRSVIIQGGAARAASQQLYRFSFALRDQRPITDEHHGALSPVFSQDGNRLAFFTRTDAGGLAIAIRDIVAARQRVTALIPSPSPVPDSVTELPHFALAPDGSAAFIADGGSLWRVNLSTGGRRIIPIEPDKP